MFTIQFSKILIFLPLLFLLFLTLALLVLNYSFFIKSSLVKSHLEREKEWENREIIPVSGDILNINVLLISYFFFIIKVDLYSFNDNFYFIYNKFIFFFIIISLIFCFFLNHLFKFFFSLSSIPDYSNFLGLLFIELIFFSLFSKNLLVFFLFIELFGYIFYLQFVQNFNSFKNTNTVKTSLDTLLLYY